MPAARSKMGGRCWVTDTMDIITPAINKVRLDLPLISSHKTFSIIKNQPWRHHNEMSCWWRDGVWSSARAESNFDCNYSDLLLPGQPWFGPWGREWREREDEKWLQGTQLLMRLGWGGQAGHKKHREFQLIFTHIDIFHFIYLRL